MSTVAEKPPHPNGYCMVCGKIWNLCETCGKERSD